MKKSILILVLLPFILIANNGKYPSTIKNVTVYLNGAKIERSAPCLIKAGTSEILFTGLSTKIDENSIQISGLQSASILSMAYDINFLEVGKGNPEVIGLENQIKSINVQIARQKNNIQGLTEEEKVITTNRLIGNPNNTVNLEQIRKISQYYRERITAINNEIFDLNLIITELQSESQGISKQLQELNNFPQKEHGELRIKIDNPVTSQLNLTLSYLVQEAGWVPTYDLKSKDLDAPLDLKYKANVYQKTGVDWQDVEIVLSTGNPNTNIQKPEIGTQYLNFIYGNRQVRTAAKKKSKYTYNPAVRRVVGQVVDQSGLPLPGCTITVKGTALGTQTDFDGNFSLNITSGSQLVFSYIGFETYEIPIYASVINIKLQEDTAVLEEVVVSGYSSTRTAAAEALSGQVVGLQINGSNGNPGSSPTIKIRGVASNSSSKNPLYIIDGIPVDGFVAEDLEPHEIASIDFLKNKSATELYGSRGTNGVVLITTKKSEAIEEIVTTSFVIKKPYTIVSDGDITAIEINNFSLPSKYEYLAAPLINENVFLTASFKDWEQYNLLPGEATLYFNGSYAGKTVLDPYTSKKEMTVSLGLEPDITVTRKQQKNYKSKSFVGNYRILNKAFEIEIKNNKTTTVPLKLVDRIPISENKEIKVSAIETPNAQYDTKKGILTWQLNLPSGTNRQEQFSFQVRYPKGRRISL